MPIMTKMRDNMPVILITLVVVFLIMIVFEWGMDYLGMKGGRHDVVGVIEGKKITYQEFSELVKRSSDQQKQQSGQEPDENTLRQIREQVWNSLVTQILVEKESQKAGIKVLDQEIVDWVKGENPPEFLVQQFRDSTGRFNRAAYENAINDPRNKEIWIQVETALKQQRLSEKMQSLVLSSVRVTPGEVQQRFMDQSIRLEAQFAMLDPNVFVADSAVQVTDEDLRKFYNENQEEYKTRASRKLKYVLFGDQPTSKDSQEVLAEFDQIKQQLAAGLDFLDIQKNYSESQSAGAFFKHGEMSQEKEAAAFGVKLGSIVGPVKDYDGFHLMKVLEEKRGSETFIRARHILLTIAADQTEESAMKIARDLAARAKKGEDFASLARQYSQEPGAAARGGDLGWFGKGRMVKPFEDAAMKGRPGEIVGPVKTQFGIHVIKIEAKDNRELKITDIHLSVKASNQTKDAAFQNAQDFVYLAREAKFEKEAEALKLEVKETQSFQKSGTIPGVGLNESISKFSFSKDLGDVSDVYQIPGGYGVFKISEVKKEGVRPFDEVKTMLQPRVLRKKKMALVKETASSLRSKIGDTGDLAALPSVDPRVIVQSTGSFLPNAGIPNVGREGAFIGTALHSPMGKVSEPVEGNRGYYLIKVLNRTSFDSVSFNMQKSILAAQILQERKQRIVGDWLEKIKEKADIEDNRDLFFR